MKFDVRVFARRGCFLKFWNVGRVKDLEARWKCLSEKKRMSWGLWWNSSRIKSCWSPFVNQCEMCPRSTLNFWLNGHWIKYCRPWRVLRRVMLRLVPPWASMQEGETEKKIQTLRLEFRSGNIGLLNDMEHQFLAVFRQWLFLVIFEWLV